MFLILPQTEILIYKTIKINPHYRMQMYKGLLNTSLLKFLWLILSSGDWKMKLLFWFSGD